MKSLIAAALTFAFLSFHANAETQLSTVAEKNPAMPHGESEFDQIRNAHRTKADKFFESAMQSKGVIPLHGAFARLWLNRELPEVNRLLREAQMAIIKQEGGTGAMTAEIANSEHVKWQMRTWNRLYQLFNDKSRFYPGRLDKDSQAMIEEMSWLYVCEKSNIKRAGLQYVWGIHGSENHEMMHYSNALLALQALKESPAYRDRKLPDGRTPREHYEAWNAYYKHYCDERAKHGWPLVLATTNYRLPDVIMDIAKDAKGRGEYVYTARRVAKQRHFSAKEVPVTYSPWYAFDADDPRMLGYDYCTPDYVMGALVIDPTLPQVSSHTYLKGEDLQEGYPALTAQNRYQAIVFATDVNARVVPQCEGLANGKTYGEQQAVQHRNILLVQRHPRAKQTGDMRILFGGKGMKERLVERDGWMILKEENAWLGVKGFSRTESNQPCGSKWDNELFLRMNDGNAPVALICGRNTDFKDLDAFAAYLSQFVGSLENGWFELSSGKEAKVTLALHLAAEALPKVNGKPVDLNPEMLFDSPFMKSVHGSGLVTIRKGARVLEIDTVR